MTDKHLHKDQILNLLPEINWIENELYKDAVINIWLEAWNESEWEDLNDVPKSLNVQEYSNIDHTRSVTKMAVDTAKILEEMYDVSIDYDVLITATLLHDVSKLIEYKKDSFTEYGEMIQHGLYGVHKAFRYDLPLEIAHIINTHTHVSAKMPATIEAIIINYVDYLDSDVLLFLLDKKLFLKK